MMNTQQRSLALYGIPVMLLCIPVIAMQFTKEVNWTVSDFVVGAVLLFGTAAIIDLVLRKIKSKRNRIILCACVIAVLFLVWAELAVGLFGSPLAGS